MTEIEDLKKQLTLAREEIATLRLRLSNVELLYRKELQGKTTLATSKNPRAEKPQKIGVAPELGA